MAEKDAEKKQASEEQPEAEAAPPEKRRRLRRAAPKAAKREAAEPKEEAPALKPGQVRVYSVDGEAIKTIDLPAVFRSEVRRDLILRAVTAFRANRRQPYGPNPRSGMKHSVRWSGKGHGVSRVPRLRGSMTGAQAPGTVGGRRAHPPRPDTVWAKKINAHERGLARNAALAALRDAAIVSARGHRFDERLSLPVVLEDSIETLEPEEGATREGLAILERLGLETDVERAKDGRHVRAGRGKLRGRRLREPRSLLVVVKEPTRVRRLFGNLPGVEVVSPAALNAEILAPGGDPGRLALFSEGALEILRSWHP
ncbi:MAG TPA: 50S ribosomal protein L4 [Thermoplasmata archaeon]|nr:50S ribosomal protein L4 [Thermoplasmata archaeon]